MRDHWYADYYERDWLWIRGLGKFLFDNRDIHSEYFCYLVADRYGCSHEAGSNILQAYTSASEIPTLWACQFYYPNCTDKPQFGATLLYGVWSGDGHPGAPGMLLWDGQYSQVDPTWIKPQTQLVARGDFVDIVDYVSGNTKAKINPDQFTDILENNAKILLESINRAATSVTRRLDEFNELLLNMQAYHYMGLHLAEKTRALLHMLRFLRHGNLKDYESGREHLINSLAHFMKQREISQRIYPNPDVDLILQATVPAVRHDWDSLIPVMRDEIDNYDKYLIMVVMHLAADRRNTEGTTIALRDFFRRVTDGTVHVWRPWLSKDGKGYWNSDMSSSERVALAPEAFEVS
ncbi:MAG: hypothetical protein A2Y21_00945 [Clostridiales bacterium GWC2_40_7]|nr:MAG: hypothetical protein A2Y21_00945 [Clostridiales bacterium GWC2_40_7]